MRCKSPQLLVALAALAMLCPPSRSAISVTGITATGTGAPYDISYILNTDAATTTVEILNASNTVVKSEVLTGAYLSRGTHHYSWDGKDNGGTAVVNGQYHARITATANPVPAGGTPLWGPVDIASGSSAPVRYGFCVNRNPASPYYGRVYVSDYSNDTIRVYTADGTKVLDISYKNSADPNDPFRFFMAGVRGPYIGQDDLLYVNVQSDSSIPHVSGCYVMNQDGTNVQRLFDTPDQQRSLVVTGPNTDRWFYYSQTPTQAESSPASLYFQAEYQYQTAFLNNMIDATAFGGSMDMFVVLDKNTDPTGHSATNTIYARVNQVGTSAGESNVVKFDCDNADPLSGYWTRDLNFDASATIPNATAGGSTGRGLGMAPDGHLWTTYSHATIATRGYYKLDKATGAKLDQITVPSGHGKPRFNTCDAKGNVLGLQASETATNTYAKWLTMFAPTDSGSTDTTTSAAFTVTGGSLPPINITDGPTVAFLSSNSATITWTTNMASTTTLAWGLSEASLPNQATGASGVTAHSVTLKGLSKTTPHFFYVRSEADGYAAAQSAILSFTTKDTLTITDLVATAQMTTANVTWTTDKPTTSVVLYGTSPDFLPLTATGASDVTSHTVNLSGLTPGTTYYFVAQSESATVELTSTQESFLATTNAQGYRVRNLSTFGDFRYGHAQDVTIGAGVTLNKRGVPNAVNDAAVPDLPEGVANHAMVISGGYVYIIGGRHPAITKNIVYYAPVNPDGTVGAWLETSPLNEERFLSCHAGFAYNGYVYVVGGGTPTTLLTTAYARQNPLDGTLGPWAVAGSFPEGTGNEREYGAVSVYRGRVYYSGGETNAGAPVATTYYADILPDGKLSAWTTATELLPATRQRHLMATVGDRLYVWGGETDAAALVYDNFTSTLPNVGPWTTTGYGLPAGRTGFAGGVVRGNALMIAGWDGYTRTDRISYAPIAADGTMGDMIDATPTWSSSETLQDLDGVAWQDRFYAAGGRASDGGPEIDTAARPFAACVTFTNDANYAPVGRYESQVFDLGQLEALQSLALTSTGSVSMIARTAGADGVWSAWSAPSPTINFAGAQAQYVQFALTLTSTGTASASASRVTLTYGTPQPLGIEDARNALRFWSGLGVATVDDKTRLDVTADGVISILDAVKINHP